MKGSCNQMSAEEDSFKEDFNSLMSLIETGNLQGVTEILNKYPEDRYSELARESQDVSDLMFQAVQKAASLGHVEIMDGLIRRGFQHVSGNYSDLPPLHTACGAGHLNVVESLINKHGVNPDEEDPVQGITPLIAALGIWNNYKVVEFLLISGASATKRGRQGISPLFFAVERHVPGLCKLLLLHGADVNIHDGFESPETPLISSILGNDFAVAKCLLDAGAEVNNLLYSYPFHIASMFCRLPLVKLLYSHGASPDSEDERGKRPIHHAIKYGKYETVRFLALEIGVKIDNMAFVMAVERGRINIADLLVQLGYDPYQGLKLLMSGGCDELLNIPGMGVAFSRWKETASMPRRLQDLCIFKIRQSVKHLSFVSSLFIPKHLIGEILMNE